MKTYIIYLALCLQQCERIPPVTVQADTAQHAAIKALLVVSQDTDTAGYDDDNVFWIDGDRAYLVTGIERAGAQ